MTKVLTPPEYRKIASAGNLPQACEVELTTLIARAEEAEALTSQRAYLLEELMDGVGAAIGECEMVRRPHGSPSRPCCGARSGADLTLSPSLTPVACTARNHAPADRLRDAYLALPHALLFYAPPPPRPGHGLPGRPRLRLNRLLAPRD